MQPNNIDIIDIFRKINLSKRYIDLCNKFSDFENSKSPRKVEVLTILNKKDLELKYSKQERAFYEEFIIDNKVFRFMLNYTNGMIGGLFILSETEITLKSEITEIIEDLGVDFFEKAEYRYPMSTSQEDLEEILNELLNIYKDFKKEFIKQYG
ncbi:hypothetical protein [Tenacibaculum finnmarkense]|uniref:hypothetical protein n=1 Tax=Tenacibaculum finnmarkense TaxID=2781243 RepID=UPI000738F69B|nr:hypothetical protein [Tenacibaculum finnmarkense]ALU75818.1 hypothetical protein AUW17_11415 [Tenacibaculum dicentrarchi]MBE7647071.1 hypothetical protein [Tenacibaculum finnmarkense genomovar ulcerans]MCD8399197.1 hypothetical protein [Tenacibaculum finnmarkense genomovar ulcerans]MCD8421747.1 hypothetical protein [Tenacibaculum finnmarkense genomovar ulcerans]MCD8431592.1 hypothetical protein [Tenacibaculum finnmarkense genomovar ulcerans]